MITNRKKRQIILSGERLAEISSKLPPPSRGNRLFWRFFILFIVVAFPGVMITTTQQLPVILVASGLGFMLGLILTYFKKWVFTREFPLVFTTRGITAGPFINELWEDIETYRLHTIEGLRRHTISKIGTGTTITLINKGFLQRTIGKSGSVFPIQGYFFDEQQQTDIRRIFREHGIAEEVG